MMPIDFDYGSGLSFSKLLTWFPVCGKRNKNLEKFLQQNTEQNVYTQMDRKKNIFIRQTNTQTFRDGEQKGSIIKNCTDIND